MTRSGDGRAVCSGVASIRMPMAARAAASRRRAPSPAVPDHGHRRNGRPGEDAIDGRVVRLGRNQPRVRDDRHHCGRLAAADAGRGGCPQPSVEADLDELDAPIEHVGEGTDRPPGGASRIVRPATDLVEKLAQGGSRGIAGVRGRGQDDLARSFSAGRLDPVELLGHGSRQDHGGSPAASHCSRHDDGQLAELSPFIGAWRIARSDQQDVHRGIEQAARETQWIAALQRRLADAPAGRSGGGDQG